MAPRRLLRCNTKTPDAVSSAASNVKHPRFSSSASVFTYNIPLSSRLPSDDVSIRPDERVPFLRGLRGTHTHTLQPFLPCSRSTKIGGERRAGVPLSRKALGDPEGIFQSLGVSCFFLPSGAASFCLPDRPPARLTPVAQSTGPRECPVPGSHKKILADPENPERHSRRRFPVPRPFPAASTATTTFPPSSKFRIMRYVCYTL